MKLSRIQALAGKEKEEIGEVVEEIRRLVSQFPLGYELSIAPCLIPKVEAFCDDNNIPFYHVTEDCCSIAATYAALLTYEEAR